MRYAMIMAGGSGTRLWPLSRHEMPKQLLRIIKRPGDPQPRSLLELSARRLEGLVPPGSRYICTGETHRRAVRESLPDFPDGQVLGEPMGRDTLNAVGFAAAVFHQNDPDAVFAVLTADQIIEPEDGFRERMELGFRLVEADPKRLVTFSITPTYPATGYGYVERGQPITDVEGCEQGERTLVHRVSRFVEKPDAARAEAYFRSGMFGWNAGMFVFHAGTMLECIRRFKPEAYDGLIRIQQAWGTDEQQTVLLQVYPKQPKISIDYGVMEPASRERDLTVCMVDMDVTWTDVGSWPSYADTLPADHSGNRAVGTGDSLLERCADTLVVNEDAKHTVALLGCEGLIVVHTPEATLVVPRDQAERLKELHARLPEGLK